MERNERRILFRAGMVWAAAPFLLAGCRGAEKMPERLKVGVSIYRDDDTYINSIVAEMKQLFQAKGKFCRNGKILFIVLSGNRSGTDNLSLRKRTQLNLSMPRLKACLQPL